jgi:hypothetical protein
LEDRQDRSVWVQELVAQAVVRQLGFHLAAQLVTPNSTAVVHCLHALAVVDVGADAALSADLGSQRLVAMCVPRSALVLTQVDKCS